MTNGERRFITPLSAGFKETHASAATNPSRSALPSAEHYLTFSDRGVLQFKTALRYEDGGEELPINHPYIDDPSRNSGRYFTTLKGEFGAFRGLTFALPAEARGRVRVQVCRYPGA